MKTPKRYLRPSLRRGSAPNRIALFGESLGTGVAVEMAARGHGSSVVLVTPYTSIPEVASRFVFGLPVRLLMRERFDSLAKAPRVAVPALLLHGTDDEVVPYAMSVKLATTFPHARLVTVAGGHHNDLFLGQGWRLFDEVADFVRLPIATRVGSLEPACARGLALEPVARLAGAVERWRRSRCGRRARGRTRRTGTCV